MKNEIQINLGLIAPATLGLLSKLIKETHDTLNKEVAQALLNIAQPFTEALAKITESLKPLHENFDLVFNPLIKSIQENYQKYGEDEFVSLYDKQQELIKSYGIYYNGISKEQLNKILISNSKTKNAYFTNLIYKNTKSHDFKTVLLENLLKKETTLKRKQIIEYGYNAHFEKKFHYSIPLFFMQIEGLITDYLFIKKLIYLKNKKIFKSIDKKELTGLYKKTDFFKKLIGNTVYSKENELCYDIADRIIHHLNQKRNNVLHGNEINYFKCKLSNELLLIIITLLCIFPDK